MRTLLLVTCMFIFLTAKLWAQYTVQPFLPPDVYSNQMYTAVSYDGKKMLTAAKNKDRWQVFEYEKKVSADAWVLIAPIQVLNNALQPNIQLRGLTFNQNADKIYFAANLPGTMGGTDIFYISRKTDGWAEPVSLGKTINSVLDDFEPSISPDENILFFIRASSEPSKYAKEYDAGSLFNAFKSETGVWETPDVLPNPINTDCERSPRIMADGRTLIFASFREDHKGDLDLYYTQMIAKKIWKTPIPIDTVNTELEENFPSIDASENKLLYLVRGKNKRTPQAKLTSFALPGMFSPYPTYNLTGVITDQVSGIPLGALVKVTDPITNQVIMTVESNEANGQYSMYLLRGNNYRLEFFKDGYSHLFKEIDLTQLNKNKTENFDVSLFNSINLTLNIYDLEIFEPLNAALQVYNTNTKELLSVKTQDVKPGTRQISLPLGQEYMITAEADMHTVDTLFFNTNLTIQFMEFERDLELEPKKREIEMAVSDMMSKEDVDVKIVITNKDRNETIIVEAKDVKDGKYKIKMREGDRYEINVKSPKGYAYYNTSVDLKDAELKKLDVELVPLKADTKITINDITFENNSADLNESSFSELNRLNDLIRDNPEILVEISAHTDDKGSDAYNKKLSEKRARSVIDYLISKGTPQNRMQAKGYGETQPLLPNTNDENRARNRRVELKILEVKN